MRDRRWRRPERRTGRRRVGWRAAGRTARVGGTGECARAEAGSESAGAQHRIVGRVEHGRITDRYGHHFVRMF